jgi:hypothetical protein
MVPGAGHPHARRRPLFVVRLEPPGQPPLIVELTLHPSDRDYTDIAQPEAGEVRGFLYDPKSGKLEFNLEDDRNNLTVMLSDADAMAAELEKNSTATTEQSVRRPQGADWRLQAGATPSSSSRRYGALRASPW